jgi:polyhydroxyalkanoate synthesis regulator phasin
VSYGYTSSAHSEEHSHSEFYRLSSDIDTLETKVRDLGEFKDGAESQLEELVDGVGTAKRETESLTEQVARLSERVNWLEGLVRHAELVEDADFDSFDAEERRLAAAALTGRAAQGRLLAEGVRAGKRALIAEVEQAERENRAAVTAGAAAAKRMGEAAPGTAEHNMAVSAFKAARKSLDDSGKRWTSKKDLAETYRAELEEDERNRRELASVIGKGQRAGTELATRLRTRIVEAVGRSALPPRWFVSVFGPTAPADKLERDRWLTAATEILVYRLTYKVTDPVRALGPEPAYGQDEYRWMRYNRLRNELRWAR